MLKSKKTILTNARIQTLNDELPIAEALCFSNGRVEAVGTNIEIKDYVASCEHEVIDCNNKFLYPGFIETHTHLTTLCKLLDYTPCKNTQISDFQKDLQDKANKTEKSQWIIGYGYDPTVIQEKRHITFRDLDTVSQDHPIFIHHVSGHMGYVNSLAIKELGITKESAIEGGIYEKDDDGELTGALRGNAVFSAHLSLPSIENERMKDLIKQCIASYNACGFTTFFEGGIGFAGVAADCLKPMLELERENELNARAFVQFLQGDMAKLAEYGLHDFGSDYITLGGLKLFTDGSIQAFSAALSEDYYTQEGNKGHLLYSQENLDAIIEKYHCMNVQIGLHTNGDLACESVISAFEKAYAKHPRKDLRHMLIHAQLITDEQLVRMDACGLMPTFFSRHIEVWGDKHASIFIGPERTARLNPAGSATRLGIKFALHVDTPNMPITALGNMHAAVNRLTASGVLYGEDEKITPLQALEGYTSSANLLCSNSIDRGIINVGNYADFVLLEKDLLEVDPLEIKDIKVLKTICGGRIVFDSTK